MQTALPTDRQTTIQGAALQPLVTDGFFRKTVDDIGLAAGLSPIALYLRYRNKVGIFRSLTLRYFVQMLADMRAALNRPE